MENLTFS